MPEKSDLTEGVVNTATCVLPVGAGEVECEEESSLLETLPGESLRVGSVPTLPSQPLSALQSIETSRSTQSRKTRRTEKSYVSMGSTPRSQKSSAGTPVLRVRSGLSTILAPLRKSTVKIIQGELLEKYKITLKLGEGAFGKVYKVVSKEDSSLMYACKQIRLHDPEDPNAFEREMSVAKKLQHPNIATLYEVLKGNSHYNLIMSLCSGGDLQAKIDFNLRKELRTPPNDCCRYCWQMLAGCAYMHHHALCHRDIKAQNYMLETPLQESPVRLIDFGIAVIFSNDTPLTDTCGTLCYMAPEVLNGSYDERCDIWSIGITMYYLFCNSLPFCADKEEVTESDIRNREPQFAESAWREIPEEVKGLLRSMLTKDHKKRPSARSIIEDHQFLREHRNGEPIGGEGSSCCSIL